MTLSSEELITLEVFRREIYRLNALEFLSRQDELLLESLNLRVKEIVGE